MHESGRIHYACDVARNPAFWQARAETVDVHGRRVCDYVARSSEVELWADQLQGLLELPVAELRDRLQPDPLRQVDIERPGRAPRQIAIPSYPRRCMANLLSRVLSLTSDRLLPSNLRAYRSGSPDAVRHTVLDVARSVKGGQLVHYAKLDIANFFPSIQWASLESALQHYGYEERFIQVVMALVQTPIVVRRGGRWVDVPRHRGIPQGLAESAILSNLVLWELDQELMRPDRRLRYWRYADDLLIGGKHRDDVVGGVRAIQRWASEQGMQLKGVVQGQNPRGLVLSVKKQRIEYLGTEISSTGQVRMPLAKLKEKLDELGALHGLLWEGDVIIGDSRLGGGHGVRWVDQQDIDVVVDGFLRPWCAMNEREAQRAEALIDKTFSTPQPPRRGGHGAVWCARLWAPQTDDGREAQAPRGARRPNVLDPSLSSRLPRPGAPSGPGAGAGGRSAAGWSRGGLGPETAYGPEERRSARASERAASPEGTRVAVSLGGEVPRGGSDGEAETDEVEAETEDQGEDEDAQLSDAEGHESNVFECPSFGEEELDRILQEMQRDTSFLDGADQADPEGRSLPLPSGFHHQPVLHLAARRLPGECSVVGWMWAVDGHPQGLAQQRIMVGRPESAMIALLIETVDATWGGELRVGLPTSFLPKALLQARRSFRAPLLFARVGELHAIARAREVQLWLAGPVQLPEALRSSLESTVVDASQRSRTARR